MACHIAHLVVVFERDRKSNPRPCVMIVCHGRPSVGGLDTNIFESLRRDDTIQFQAARRLLSKNWRLKWIIHFKIRLDLMDEFQSATIRVDIEPDGIIIRTACCNEWERPRIKTLGYRWGGRLSLRWAGVRQVYTRSHQYSDIEKQFHEHISVSQALSPSATVPFRAPIVVRVLSLSLSFTLQGLRP
jgi:hypothetical protein